ncbi:MAG: hypothetical protein IPG71_13520 [bacterium]|nr:hypothetical protein [bacterium]
MEICLKPVLRNVANRFVIPILLTMGASVVRGQTLDLALDNVNFTNDATVALSCFDTEMQQANAFTTNLFGNQIGVWTFADARCSVDDCCWPTAFFGDAICRGHAQAGGSVYGNGFQSQEVRIRYFMHGSGNGKDSPNGYFLTANGNLTFSITVIVQGAPPGFPLDLYGAWRHFGGIRGIDAGDAALTTAQLNIGPWGEVLTNRFNFDSSIIPGFNRQRADLPGVTVFNGDTLSISVTAIGNSTTANPNPGHPCANEDFADFIQTGEVVLRIGAQPVLSEPDSLIAGAQYLEFSVDIGSDAEKSDPQADGDEVFDPGDAYISTQVPLPLCGADGSRDDQFYQAFDCFPNAPDCSIPALTRAPVGSGYPIDSVRSSFGDMDGLDNLDVQLEQFQYGPGFPGIGYFLSTCITRAEYIYISYEDDSPNLFTDSLTPSVPVNSQPLYMPQTYSTELFGLAMWGLGTYPKSPALIWNYVSESQLHVNLAPDPGPEGNDDDVDAIDIRDNTCSEWYFPVDHEAGGCVAGLNPGAIYRADNAGPVLIVDPQLHLGLPPGTDVQDFEFAWMDDFLPPNAFTTLALFFTVDEDDPGTPDNESGFLNPAMIYWSILDGAPPLPVLNGPLENPIDGLAAWAVPLMTANINPGCTRDYDLLLAGQTIHHLNSLDFNDDCALSPLPDHIARVTVPYAGDWSFNLCRTQYNYDLRLYLMDNCCGGNQLAFNDDYCGALPSICVYLQPGDYYLIIEGPPGTPYQLSAGPVAPPRETAHIMRRLRLSTCPISMAAIRTADATSHSRVTPPHSRRRSAAAHTAADSSGSRISTESPLPTPTGGTSPLPDSTSTRFAPSAMLICI